MCIRSRLWFYLFCIFTVFSLALTGCSKASTDSSSVTSSEANLLGAGSVEQLGTLILDALKASSPDGYMKFVRTKQDWTDIINMASLSSNDKNRIIREKMEKLEKNRSGAKNAFEEALESGKSLGIAWDRAEFKKLEVEWEEDTAGVKEISYNVIFSIGEAEYCVVMLGVVQTKRGYTLNTLYNEVKELSKEIVVKPAEVPADALPPEQKSGPEVSSVLEEQATSVSTEGPKLGALIKDLIGSDLCKEYVVSIKGLRSAMALSGDENNPEGLRLINESRASGTAVVMNALQEMGQLEEKDREEVQRLVMEALDAECAGE